MRQRTLLGMGSASFHRLAYVEWGAPENPNVLVCVHGMTRNGRDFDFIAAALEDSYRVVCPDVLGRGASGRAASINDYNNRQYAADAMTLVARTGADSIDWLGTSMGGLIGIIAASMPGTPIRRLILNDIGPWIPQAALARIAGYIGRDPHFDDMAAAEAYFRTVHAPFGVLTESQWRQLAVHSVGKRDDGGYGLLYDPAIADALGATANTDFDLWDLWDRIEVPVLVLRGADSDLLTCDVAAEMKTRGPNVEVIEFPGCGHAPALMDPAQIAAVRNWLLR